MAGNSDPGDDGRKRATVPALDELFAASRAYRTSERYLELMRFIRKFRKYSPFNCFLLHMQRPSVSYVATPGHWRSRFNRTIKEGAHPLVILAPMSPVLFVFDAADTEGEPLPDGLVDPYATKGKLPQSIWNRTVANLARDRIRLVETELEWGKAGGICGAEATDLIDCGEAVVRALYRIEIGSVMDRGGKYATLAHELGHLYAGHLGTPDTRWWPDRRQLSLEKLEFEAESICWLVCERAGIQNPSDAYLANYLGEHGSVPEISLDRVLKAAGMIEEMGKRQLPLRKV